MKYRNTAPARERRRTLSLAHRAYMSDCGSLTAAPDLLSWRDVFAGHLSACPAPADFTQASELAKLLCADAAKATNRATATWEACLQCEEGAPGRADLVTSANFSESGSVLCCNILDQRFGESRVLCTASSSPLLIVFPLLLFAAALIVTLFRISPQSRAVREAFPLLTCPGPLRVAMKPDTALTPGALRLSKAVSGGMSQRTRMAGASPYRRTGTSRPMKEV